MNFFSNILHKCLVVPNIILTFVVQKEQGKKYPQSINSLYKGRSLFHNSYGLFLLQKEGGLPHYILTTI